MATLDELSILALLWVTEDAPPGEITVVHRAAPGDLPPYRVNGHPPAV